MKRLEALVLLAELRGDAPAVVSPSFGGRLLFSVAHEPATIYNMELCYSTAVCTGLALAMPDQPIYAIEGDGSIIAGLPVLTTIGRYQPANLRVVVFNNRSWASTGAQPTAARTNTDIVGMASSAGIANALEVSDLEHLRSALKTIRDRPGPHFMVIDVDDEDLGSVGEAGAYPFDLVEAAIQFRRALETRGMVPTIWAV